MSKVRYRVVRPEEHTPPEEHEPLGGNEYLAPDDDGLDALDVNGVVDVVDWDYRGEEARFSPDTPPEPVVRENDDGERITEVYHIHEDTTRAERPTYPKPVELGTWECQRCGAEQTLPITNGELQEPHECQGCERQGPFTHAELTGAEVNVALAAHTGVWRPPSTVNDAGYADLWGDVREYLRDHWDAAEPEVYDGLTAYALSTWVRENLTFVPHLMLMGKTTGGKTRLLNTLARVSYRAVVTASATPASMFRLIEDYNVTYYISEYHGLEYDARRELDAVVRAGQKRGEVINRAEPTSDGYKPKVFDPFAHVAIATQFTPDDDIVNRCIQVRSSPANRDMPAVHDEDRARDLRDRLLYARFRLLHSDEWAAAEADAYAYLAKRNITGRTREKLLGLLTVAHIWDRVDAIGPFVDAVVQQDREAAADSEDALVVEAIRDLAFEEIGKTAVIGDADPFAAVDISLTDIADRYEDMTGTEKSASWVGHVRSRLGLEKARKRDGTVISDPDLGPKLRQLCEEHNLGWERLDSHRVVEELDEDEAGYRAECSECGNLAAMTHRHVDEGHHMCERCAADWEDADP